MVYAYIDNDEVAKACPREYFSFMMALKKNHITLEEFAKHLSEPLEPEPKSVIKEYEKLRVALRRKKKIPFRLTTELYPEKRYWYGANEIEYKDIENKNIPKESFNKPVWVTPVQFAPVFKKENIKTVIKKD